MAKEDNMEQSAQDIIESTDDKIEKNRKVQNHAKHHGDRAHEHKHHAHKSEKNEYAKSESKACSSKCCGNGWMIVSIIFIVATILFLVLWLTKGASGTAGLGEEEIKVEMKSFIDGNLLQPGTTSTVTTVEDLGQIYKLDIDVQGQKITSYSTKDGKIFFPSGLVIDEVLNAPAEEQNGAPPAPTSMPKNDLPVVEVFVMSHCPYGTQIEKGMLPVVDLLGDKADIQIKFVNYAMHGQKEIDEQLNQYCIQQEYSDKYYKYLQCFLNDSNTERCVAELGFSQTILDACIAATDAEFGISKDYADQSTWRGSFPSFSIHSAENTKYGVQGSPTLVINGAVVSSARDSQSLKTAICNAFTTAPVECDTALPTANPSPGFGYGTSATDMAAAQCG